MNAEALLAHYERIAESPDAIARLRRFVLELAVRGRLVPQHPSDEPAGQLLSRISLQFKRAVEDGTLTRPKPTPPISDADALFALPAGWAFARFGDVVAIQTNLVDPKWHQDLPHVAPDNIESWTGRLLTYGTVREARVFSGKHLFASGAVLYSKIRPKLAKVTKVDFAGLCSADMYPLHPLIDRDFLVTFMITPIFVDQAASEENRVAMPKINQAALSRVVVPVPPLAEQDRIVTKVSELMALCDRLEAARTAREATRDRLAVASLARLNTPDPETFPADARFALAALPALTTRPDQIKQLRQTILNLAVRGKLVPQSVEDPTESSRRSSSQVEDGRLDMPLPSGWRWVRLDEVASARLGKMLDASKNKGRPVPYLRNTNVHWFDIRTDDLKTLLMSEDEISEYRLIEGDVLICEGGHGIGRTAVWRGGVDEVVFQKALHRVRPSNDLSAEFFAQCCFVYFDSGIMQSYFTGVGIPHFTGKALAKLTFPLPPLEEQRRIVAKVEELMALCEALEASLAAATAARTHLLEATLAEALSRALSAAQDDDVRPSTDRAKPKSSKLGTSPRAQS